MPEMTRSIVAKYAQKPLTTSNKPIASNIELIPHIKKKMVRIHLYFPNAYSLTILQPGLNSGLTKCSTNRDNSDIRPAVNEIVIKIFMIYDLND